MNRLPKTAAEQEERINAAAAKAAMLRDDLPLQRAAAKYHVRSASILRWFEGTIVREPSGDYRALPDHEPFEMLVVGHDGPVAVMTRSSEERAIAGQHTAAIKAALDPDRVDPRPLIAMKGIRVAGVELETDPEVILDLALAGELDFLEIYLTSSAAG